MSPCRCGRATDKEHMCHGRGYACPNVGSVRFYTPQGLALSGMQMKVQAQHTVACDRCWEAFLSTKRNDGSGPAVCGNTGQ